MGSAKLRDLLLSDAPVTAGASQSARDWLDRMPRALSKDERRWQSLLAAGCGEGGLTEYLKRLREHLCDDRGENRWSDPDLTESLLAAMAAAAGTVDVMADPDGELGQVLGGLAELEKDLVLSQWRREEAHAFLKAVVRKVKGEKGRPGSPGEGAER